MSFTETENLIARYDAATTALDQAVTDRLSASIDASFRNLIKELERQYPTWQSEGSLYASQRRLLLVTELGALLDVINPAEAAQYQALLQDALNLSHTTGATLADELITATDPNYPLADFVTIPVEAAALQARDGVQRLSRYNEDFRNAASSVIEQGLIQGFGTKKVQSILEKELGVTKSKAETLARTEVMSALNSASQQRYQDNKIKYVQVFNTPSENTCPFCVARNGNVYEVGNISVPFHPRCRDVLSPWVPEWVEDGLIDVEETNAYAAKGIADLEALGQKPDYGATFWERKAGLTEAPKPVWRPGDAVEPRAQKAPDPVPVVAASERNYPAKLPADTVVTTSARITPARLDAALDAIDSPGARERVGMFRDFVEKSGVQAIFVKTDGDMDAHVRMAKQALKDQSFTAFEPFEKGVMPLENANGFTWGPYNHVVVNTNDSPDKTREPLFAPRGDKLSEGAKRALDGADDASPQEMAWTMTSVMRGWDTQEFSTYLHEMGHQIHSKAGNPSPPPDIQGSVTDYGSTNEMEWFAEHFNLWMLDANAYEKADPVGAQFVRDTLEKATAAADIMKPEYF